MSKQDEDIARALADAGSACRIAVSAENKAIGCEARLDALAERLGTLYSHALKEIARQAVELAAEIANQFAAARRDEIRELTERVDKLLRQTELFARGGSDLVARIAALEAWTHEMDEMEMLPEERDG